MPDRDDIHGGGGGGILEDGDDYAHGDTVYEEDDMETEAYRSPDDGMCFDDHDRQGRSPEQVAANAKATPWIWLAAAVLAVVIALCAAGGV